MTCFRLLARAGDPRAGEILATAHADLLRHAAGIDDPGLRHRFLNGVPEHREIAAAWAALGEGDRGSQASAR